MERAPHSWTWMSIGDAARQLSSGVSLLTCKTIMRLVWNMWMDAKTREKALKLCDRILEHMDVEALEKTVEPYPKTGGFVVSFATRLASERWRDAVVEAIALGQRLGYEWRLMGSVHDNPSGWSNQVNVSGVESIEWTLLRVDSGGTG